LKSVQATDAHQCLLELRALYLELALVREHLPRHAGMRGARGDALGRGLAPVDRTDLLVRALALVNHPEHAVAGDRDGHEHDVAALAEPRDALAAEGERLHLQLDPIARPRAGCAVVARRRPRRRRGVGRLAGGCALGGFPRRLAHEEPASSSSSAFWAWRRFSACSQMRCRSPYRTSAEIPSPGWAGGA